MIVSVSQIYPIAEGATLAGGRAGNEQRMDAPALSKVVGRDDGA